MRKLESKLVTRNRCSHCHQFHCSHDASILNHQPSTFKNCFAKFSIITYSRIQLPNKTWPLKKGKLSIFDFPLFNTELEPIVLNVCSIMVGVSIKPLKFKLPITVLVKLSKEWYLYWSVLVTVRNKEITINMHFFQISWNIFLVAWFP